MIHFPLILPYYLYFFVLFLIYADGICLFLDTAIYHPLRQYLYMLYEVLTENELKYRLHIDTGTDTGSIIIRWVACGIRGRGRVGKG